MVYSNGNAGLLYNHNIVLKHPFLSLFTEMVPKSSVLSVLALAFSYVVISSELNYPAVFNFGDSNSDTGGLAAGIGFHLGKPYGQTFFHEPSGRFCDGRLIIDFLMEDAMELPFLIPYLDSVGAPSFHRGCNFATAGSTILLESGSYEKESYMDSEITAIMSQFMPLDNQNNNEVHGESQPL